ncbi:8862_t:CDS:1, partial [Paraglomus brasilianum]
KPFCRQENRFGQDYKVYERRKNVKMYGLACRYLMIVGVEVE